MSRASTRWFGAVVVVAAVAVLRAAQAPPAPDLSIDQKLAFLKSARVLSSRAIGKGVTHPYRLTLEGGGLTHDAAFQGIDEQKWETTFDNGRTEGGFRDYWGYNIAAFEVSRLLGWPDFVAPSVERAWNGKRGALTWWIDAKWDEEARRKAGALPEDAGPWNRQVQMMYLMTELTADTDRNMGNVLVTQDWRMVLIDFTRAFRLRKNLAAPQKITWCDPGVVARLKALTPEAVKAATGKYLGPDNIKTMLLRGEALVVHCAAVGAKTSED